MELVPTTTEIRIHPTRVFVGGLARGTSELDLENFFSEFGAITDVRIVCDKRTGLNKGYGFVTYENPESRDNLLKMGLIDFCGRKLRLRQAIRRKGYGQFISESEQTSLTNGCYQWVFVQPSTDYRVIPTVYYPQASTTNQMYTSYQYIPAASCGYTPGLQQTAGTTYYYQTV